MYYSGSMRKIPLITLFYALFMSWGVVCLSGCVAPVDLSSFIKDDEVAIIIEQGATVDLIFDPEVPTTLKKGNRKITGLDRTKYYLVEEWKWEDDNSNPPKPPKIQYVTPSGALSENLKDIGRVINGDEKNGGEIIGLTNRNHYRVTVAGALPAGTVTYSIIIPPGFTQPVTNSEGEITLQCSDDDGIYVYAFPLSLPFFSFLRIAEVFISPSGRTEYANTSNNSVITMIKQDTEIDYVFLREISGEIFKNEFYYLSVKTDPIPPEPGEDVNLVINVTALSITGQTIDFTPSSASFSHTTLWGAGSKVVTITLNDTGNVFSNIKWTLDGTPMTGNGNTLNIDFDYKNNPAILDFLVPGTYTITIEATADGVPYSGNLNLVITP